MSSKKKKEFGLMEREALDAETTRIAQQKLRPHEYDPASPHFDDGLNRFAVRVQGGEIRIQSRLEFLPTLQLIDSKRRTADL
jgi:hypothetical protein